MTAVHQFLPTLEPGATGNHALLLQRALRDAGYESELFAEFIAPPLADRGRPFGEYARAARDGDTLVYQLATGSRVADFLMERPESLVVNYHNFTPPEYFAGWEPGVVPGIEWGQRQRARLATRAALGLAVSEYNAEDLRRDGYRSVRVSPVLIDPNEFMRTPDASVLARLDADRDGANLVFVGRIAPNKCQHDLVKVLAAYRRAYDPQGRLHLVGGSSAQRYRDAIAHYADDLGLADAVDLTGPVDDGTLAAYYARADVFVSMSEHEGFCVPVIEAMHHGVPVVAYAAAAVPETVADAAVLLDVKSPERFAAAIHSVMTVPATRSALVDAGKRRAATFDVSRTSRAAVEAIATVAGAPT